MVVLIALAQVSIATNVVAGAIQRYQTVAPTPSPPCAGSPASVVASVVNPLTLRPVRSSLAAAASSFRGSSGGLITSRTGPRFEASEPSPTR